MMMFNKQWLILISLVASYIMSLNGQYVCHDTYRGLTNCSMNCKTLPINLIVSSITTMSTEDFDLKCLEFFNFITTNTSMNATLYNCALDCFFDWNVTKINQKQNVTISRQVSQSSISYYLTSDLFSYFEIVCRTTFNQDQITTSSPILPIALEKPTFYQSSKSPDTILSYTPNASRTVTNLPTAVRQAPVCANSRIGLDCNTSINLCLMAQPCIDNGTCIPTPSSCICLCPSLKFIGINCEIDIRSSKTDTCLSYKKCIETNPVSLICQCEPGYEGIHCDSLINYCDNLTYQNNGQCRPSQLNFTCECTTTDYSGRYCEIESSLLAMIQRVNLSFAYIALLAMICTGSTVVLMDVLRYGFNIDPVKPERRRLERKKHSKVYESKLAIRFTYVNSPQLETIHEECEV